MIFFEFQTTSDFVPTIKHKQWLKMVIRKEDLTPGDVSYLFCDDSFLLKQNIQFLNHNTYTDIITFEQNIGNVVSGNIMISLDRVRENAEKFDTTFEKELLRVIVHGVLHLVGYKDKTDQDAAIMRKMEEESIQLFYEKFDS